MHNKFESTLQYKHSSTYYVVPWIHAHATPIYCVNWSSMYIEESYQFYHIQQIKHCIVIVLHYTNQWGPEHVGVKCF